MTKKRTSDYLKRDIKKTLFPVAELDGFRLHKPKELIRVNSTFFDSIIFQLSQHGSKRFYVHYNRKLLIDPTLNLSSYSFGYRLSDNSLHGDQTDWCGFKDKQSEDAIESVTSAYRNTIKPWFEFTSSMPNFIFEYLVKTNVRSTNSVTLALAFYEAGKRYSASHIFESIVDENSPSSQLEFSQEYLDVAEAEGLEELRNNELAIKFWKKRGESPPEPNMMEHKTTDELVQHWRSRNLLALKKDKYIV